ncbi:hypothetical protein VSO51_21390, partial [Klebsiella pneumoniae]|nr:hypothetical protein [Klebsiella pneumoniae]
TVCVVGKMRDLSLQLSKSSIYSTKPTKTPNLKFLSHNALLKNAVLMLAEYGEITIDLVVKNVIVITLDNANEESESYYQISCQFKFRHLDDQRRIEKILLDLILEAKRKKRI